MQLILTQICNTDMWLRLNVLKYSLLIRQVFSLQSSTLTATITYA